MGEMAMGHWQQQGTKSPMEGQTCQGHPPDTQTHTPRPKSLRQAGQPHSPSNLRRSQGRNQEAGTEEETAAQCLC